MKISTSEDGKVEVQTFAVNSASRDMIAELMIIYNYHVAEFCYKNQIPAAYRTQEQPQIERAYGIVGDPLAWYLTSRHLKRQEYRCGQKLIQDWDSINTHRPVPQSEGTQI